MRTKLLTCGAAVASLSIVGLAALPAAAATSVAQASGSAISLTAGGQDAYSGEYAVTNDGKKQTASGSNKPQLTALPGQNLISEGTLAQDATTSVSKGKGSSAACAGLAGPGASLVSVGENGCLAGGDTLDLGVGRLDFSDANLVASDSFGGLDTQLRTALGDAGLDALLDQLESGAQGVLDQLGNPGIGATVGAIQSTCTATPSGVDGDSTLADVGLYVQIPGGERVSLASFDPHPAPNTKVVTNLDGVVNAILDELRSSFADSIDDALDSPLAPLAPLFDALGDVNDQSEAVDALVTQVLGPISDQLAPLEENVLDATLNEQTKGDGSITVSALDLRLLPAAAQFGLDEALRLKVGTSSCGPNGAVTPVDDPTTTPSPTDDPVVPTSVPAGESGGTGVPLLAAFGVGGAVLSLVATRTWLLTRARR